MVEISIVIVNCNTRDLLRRCLLSVVGESAHLSLEVFVVENGSRDGSGALVRQEFPQVRLVENKENLGFARAVNQALKLASGQAFLLLNTDAQLLKGALKTLWDYLKTHPQVGAVGAQLVDQNGQWQNAVDLFPSFFTELLNKSLLKILFPKRYPSKRSQFTEPVEVPALIGAAMLVRRETVQQVGFLDEAYFFFMEETDWCYRMRQAGWKVVHVPQARIVHLGGETAKKFSWHSKVEYYRSRYLFFRKHRSAGAALLLGVGLCGKILTGILTTGFLTVLSLGQWRSIRSRFEHYCCLLWWHLRGCPATMGLSSVRGTP